MTAVISLNVIKKTNIMILILIEEISYSDPRKVSKDARKGCPLSSILFNIYIGELIICNLL